MPTTMKVLINIKSFLDNDPCSETANSPDAFKTLCETDAEWRNELARNIFRKIAGLYSESISDFESYVDRYNANEDRDNICFGFTHPKSVALTARGWNDTIRKTFADAVLALEKNHTSDGKLPLDNSFTYAVKKAAKALDNDFDAYANFAVALSEFSNGLSCIIDDASLADIIARPERYAVVTVHVQ